MNATREVQLECKPSGKNGIVHVVARYGDEMKHADKLDVARASARKRFIDELLKKCPALDRADIERELLGAVDRFTESSDRTSPEHVGELDTTRIVRPELFHTPAVSGVAVPATRVVGGKPQGRWTLYLRWVNGQREQRELESAIELPDGGRLWVYPVPNEPTPTRQASWTAGARKAWLEGTPAPDPGEVFKRICERLAWYLEFPPDIAPGTVAALTLWVLLSYAYPAWSSVPYLAVTGALGSGKTTVFRVLARLVFRPLKSSNMTAACLFRTLHDCGGTLFLDEAERLRDPDAGELRSILLSGYKRGSPAMRLEKQGDTFRRLEFDLFGPKALAGIASLPEALASRCLRLTMFRAAPNSPKPRRRLDKDPAVWSALRNELHALALEHGSTWLELAKRDDVCPATLGGREFELWQPLLALATWLEESGASGLLGIIQEHAAQMVDMNRDDSVSAADETLLRLLAGHVRNGTNSTLKAGDLLKQAAEEDPATFRKWSPKGAANAFRRYGIQTKRGHGNIGRTYSTVTLEVLRRIEQAYGFELGLPSCDVSQASQVSQTGRSAGVSGASCDTCDTCDTYSGSTSHV